MQFPRIDRQALRFLVASMFAATGLASSCAAAGADMISIGASSDATIEDSNGDGTFDTVNATSLSDTVRQFPGIVIDRSVLEFGLQLIPQNAIIESATFEFQTSAIANSGTMVNLLGYQGSGIISLADATASATSLTSYNPTSLGLGVHEITLGSAAIQLLQSMLHTPSGNQFALRLQGTQNTNTSIDSIEAASTIGSQTPTLVLTYVVPEPGSLTLCGIAAACLPALLRSRRYARALLIRSTDGAGPRPPRGQ